jgi:uncharacterized cupredoxin-like copper-binding protein
MIGLASLWVNVAPGQRSALRADVGGRDVSLPGHVVDVVAGDFFLEAPDTIPAGLTTLRLRVTQGEHIAVLVLLDPGHTALDLLRARRDGHPRPAWMHAIGGPGFPPVDGTSNATMILPPGQYVLICDVAGSDGVRHVEKGMFHPVVVTAAYATSSATALPQPDAVVKMRDNVFAFSRPLHAGTRVLRVMNEGTIMHEFRMVHVLPGRTARESISWTPDSKTPRPDEDITAMVGIMPGGELTTTVRLVQGEYVVLCVAQLSHGMMQAVTVGPASSTKP